MKNSIVTLLQKQIFKSLIIILAIFLISGCAKNVESPVIYFSNASANPMRDIQCDWNGNILSLKKLNPGDTRSRSFFISSNNKFFGPIYITWFNANGERNSKNFSFRKENLPSINDKTSYNYVQLYFDQVDVEVTSSDSADLNGKVRRMELLMNKYHDDFLRSGAKANFCANNDLNVCQNTDNSSLIAIKKKQADITPGTY
ncbi:MAG: hypothetical protein SFV53_06525 [Rickettsiales bacterium]|nr:hypothetical protein [Rickettsiales bacterium]